MEDSNPNTLGLPPGCQFFPSDHQLITHYLTHKNNATTSTIIPEIDLYRFEPFDLPDTGSFVFGREGKRKHWYCFVSMPRVKRGRGEKRKAGGGFWKRSGVVKDVVGDGVQGVVVGTRKMFVFYLGDSIKTGVRTKWVMYEYALTDQKMAEATYVLCRVFSKSHHRCNAYNNVMKPCCENVKTVRHIGIQCGDTSGTLISESKMVKRSSVDFAENNTLSCKISDLPAAVQVNTMTFEGDFIELNDLLCPLEDVN